MESSNSPPLPPPVTDLELFTEEFDEASSNDRKIRSIMVKSRKWFPELFTEESLLPSNVPVEPLNDPTDSMSSIERWEATRSSDDESETNFQPQNQEFREKHISDDQSRSGRRRSYSEYAISSSSHSSDDSDRDRSTYRSHRSRVTRNGSTGPTTNENSSLARKRREVTFSPPRRNVFSTTKRNREFSEAFGRGDRSRPRRRRRRLSEYATSSSSSSLSDDSDRSRRSRVTSRRSVGPLDGSTDGDETIRFSMVVRQWKKDFRYIERVNGRMVNILEGLELHRGVFSAAEQKRIVDSVYDFQEKGRNQQLRERTYSEPRKWMRGKGRVTIQFGCCYNYATDKNGNPPGIIRDKEVDPIPPILKWMIKRMVAWHVLPPACVPNSCIVNIYERDDCIPPHIDHHDFVRPFCTVSFLAECNILFGMELKILGPGEFSGSTAIPLPKGSVLILNGNGADVAKHCVPAVPAKRISITFRKMDDGKLPFKFVPDPELENLTPLPYPPFSSRSFISPEATREEPVAELHNSSSRRRS